MKSGNLGNPVAKVDKQPARLKPYIMHCEEGWSGTKVELVACYDM